ncbi:MAG: hypothetical protein IPI01_11400 [Ignavibacteriae bacterium]|nr:hypothetical protein [Ignavibacteriota bacterium]
MKNMRVTQWMVWMLVAVVSAGVTVVRADDDELEKARRAVREYIQANPYPAVVNGGVPAPMKPEAPSLAKTSGTMAQKDRKSFFMNGNRIAVELYNYGGIAPGYDALRAVNNLVWRNLDYAFQFCPIVGASVPDAWVPGSASTSSLTPSGTIRTCGK